MKFYVSCMSPWAPGVVSPEEWNQWKIGNLEIANEKISPKIEFTDPLFRRRFSQITKMTVQVVHDLIERQPEAAKCKILFSSFRGEIEREFAIDKMLIEDQMILPAAFSLSVFNTPIAAATIAMGLKSGYSVTYPSGGNFKDALTAAAASVLSGDQDKILFVYADEKIPEQYGEKIKGDEKPLAFACIISSCRDSNGSCTNVTEFDADILDYSVTDFLRKCLP